MRTLAGKECRHYFQDFHRGRNAQECRLIKYNPASMRWRPGDCSKCPVPDILNANASPNLRIEVTITPRILGLGRQLDVQAYCREEPIPLEQAYTGCVEGNQGIDLFRQALEQPDDD